MDAVCSWITPIFHLREIFILASNHMITAFVKFLKHFVIFPVEKLFNIEIWCKLKGQIELNAICFILRPSIMCGIAHPHWLLPWTILASVFCQSLLSLDILCLKDLAKISNTKVEICIINSTVNFPWKYFWQSFATSSCFFLPIFTYFWGLPWWLRE